LTIRVDNSPNLVSVGGSHALSEHTQTNWNGIIGRMHLEATGNLRITAVKTTPHLSGKSVDVQLGLHLPRTPGRTIQVEVQASSYNSPKAHTVPTMRFELTPHGQDATHAFTLPLGDEALLWS